MASSDPEIKDGFTLPVWMKTKPTKEFEPFATSPPAHEDSFFYIKYPKTDVLFGVQNQDQGLTRVVNDQAKEVIGAVPFNTTKDKDWSKHTKPCQDVLHGIAPINTAVSSKPKPAGTDDGFKGEGAACGNSVVKVAHQMITSRGFTVASPGEEAGGVSAVSAVSAAQYAGGRRGSRSLPVTPTASPTSRRKLANRFFTSPFEPVESSNNRSWLTAALLGLKKDLTTSTSTLAEEDALEVRLQGSLAESVESLGPAHTVKSPMASVPATAPAPAKPKSNAFKPKPNELREMNFWSPTSM